MLGYIVSFLTYKNMIFIIKCYNYYIVFHLVSTGCYILYKIYNFGKYILYKIYPSNIKLLDYNINKSYNDWLLV